jgi:hypothetical protein
MTSAVPINIGAVPYRSYLLYNQGNYRNKLRNQQELYQHRTKYRTAIDLLDNGAQGFFLQYQLGFAER